VKQSILAQRRVYQIDLSLAANVIGFINEPKESKKLVLQFIYHPSISSIQSYLFSFDLDIVQAAFDGQKVLSTWSFIRAINTGTFICYNLTNNLPTLKQSVIRIAKYFQKNYKLLYPHEFVMRNFLSLEIHKLKNYQGNYYSSNYHQFGQNNDYFQLQNKFFNIYVNQPF
jgi:hypothetical protein